MTKHEMEDRFWGEFLSFCATTPEGRNSDIIFWLDYHYPAPDNFWEWMMRYKQDELTGTHE